MLRGRAMGRKKVGDSRAGAESRKRGEKIRKDVGSQEEMEDDKTDEVRKRVERNGGREGEL